ncbi:MAG TPA: elongation factor P maturation arginine rhamnosyltransferase EarP [Gallionellaceae bacterium]
MKPPITCDIFCTVVDNYGDIGVSWRLARQLANEHGVAVRLWLDDLASLQRLCPELDAGLERQVCRGVEVAHWSKEFPEAQPADLVVEAFACELPPSYIRAMAAQEQKPVWVNLEYLSAEDWVEGCHKLPSPRPNLPLVKYFFFPGFTPKTGGLLLERDLLARRDAFQRNPAALDAFWHGLNLPPTQANELRISLFCYENPAIPELLQTWESGTRPITCLVPEGRALPQVAAYFGATQPKVGDAWSRGRLQARVLPFVEQARYDELLWACDINFVRGEDSFVRAQWAGKPLIWHIYPQHDGVHMQKLRAFLEKYCAGLTPDAAQALHGLWEGWNGAGNGVAAWNDFAARQSMLAEHAQFWAQALSGNSLALNLLDFFREIGKIRPFGIKAGRQS